MAYRGGSLEALLLEGDEAALGRVSRWIAEVVTSPRYWLLRQEWPDMHQESLARLVESLRQGRYDPTRDLRSYVQGIAHHTSLRRLHDRLRKPSVQGLDEVDPVQDPDQERQALARHMVRRVLDMASEECRDLIRAYFLEGRDYARIAGDMDVPVGTVKSRLFRCLESARRELRRARPAGFPSARK